MPEKFFLVPKTAIIPVNSIGYFNTVLTAPTALSCAGHCLRRRSAFSGLCCRNIN